ncbi:MAG: bifunctional (p)ppGpp synthetase/guanosine-3',5'-bis(diphosphate) 3'-pyrophosphohydrolase [Phycisphaerales bacterium]|nr:bifunctional (p)ppGpp synthetase/guanosine-3',5'-bis(diphosphate) 3'-pyrophosphohydrolase [Phycisphaerales bacterium]
MSTTHHGPLFQQAASFAARQHRHQLRRDGRTPYTAHVFRVALTVVQVFGCRDDQVLAAALLHDTIEDTTTDYEDIESRFGKEIAGMVSALTKNMALPESKREHEYDRRLARANWRVRLIKLADTYDNFCDALDAQGDRGAEIRPDLRPKLADHLDKCERAIRLARRDAATHPASRRAISAVEILIRDYRRG